MIDTYFAYPGMSVGHAIKNARTAAGYTQEALAKKLGYTRPTISQWEKGSREPTVAAFLRILDVCGTSLSQILPDTEASDIKLHELLVLWKKLGPMERMCVLTTARQQAMPDKASNIQ